MEVTYLPANQINPGNLHPIFNGEGWDTYPYWGTTLSNTTKTLMIASPSGVLHPVAQWRPGAEAAPMVPVGAMG
jgi:hypothetical protein